MANYQELKNAVTDVIKTNGNQEITGQVMQNVLLSIINSIGNNYQYAGEAKADTNPGTPDGNVFYITTTPGSYINFNNIEVKENEFAVLYNQANGAWSATKYDVLTSFGLAQKTGESTKETISQNGITKVFAEILKFAYDIEVKGRTGNRLAKWILGSEKGNKIKVDVISGDTSQVNYYSVYRSPNGSNVISPVFIARADFGATIEVPYDPVNPYIYLYTTNDFATEMIFSVKYGYSSNIEEKITELENQVTELENSVDMIEKNVFKFYEQLEVQAKNVKSFGKYTPSFDGLVIKLVPNNETEFANFSVYKAKNEQGDGLVSILPNQLFNQTIAVPYDSEYPFIYVFGYLETSTVLFNGILFVGKSESLEERVEELETNQSRFQGKNILCFGDSITEQKDANNKSYTDYLAEYMKANVINVGIGGANLRQRVITLTNPDEFTSVNQAYAYLDILNMVKWVTQNDWVDAEKAAEYIANNSSDDNRPIIERAKNVDIQNVDIVTIFGGTNDFSANNLIWGTDDSTEVTAIKGAVNLIISYLLNANPKLKIFFFTPIIRYINSIADENWSDIFEVTEEYRPEALTKNYFLYDIGVKIEEACKYNHIPCRNWYWDLGWNKINFSQYFTAPDGTHPKKGYDYLARKIANYLETNA